MYLDELVVNRYSVAFCGMEALNKTKIKCAPSDLRVTLAIEKTVDEFIQQGHLDSMYLF